jgi:hypothetical protein
VTPDQALAREEIRHTLSVYNTAGDRGRLDELASTFTADGVLEFGETHLAGRRAIVAGLGGGNVQPTRTEDGDAAPGLLRHQLTTSRVEFGDEGRANVWTYFMVVTAIGLDHCGVYVDRFAEVDGRWLIEHRRVKVEWRDPRSTMRADLPAAGS